MESNAKYREWSNLTIFQCVFEEKCQCEEKLSTEYLEASEGASNRHPKCK